MGEWTVCIDDAGAVGDPLPSAIPGTYSFATRFRPGEFTFDCHLTDPVLATDLPYGDEMVTRLVNLYEDGELRWRGRPSPWEADLGGQTVTIRCTTRESDFGTRFFGWAERPNLLENGGFEDWTAGLPDDWAVEGAATVSEEAAVVEGGSSAELTATDGNSYLWQQESTGVDVDYYPGLTAILTAYGLVVSGSVAQGDVLAKVIVDGAPGNFDEDYAAGEPLSAGSLVRASAPIFVAGGVNWTGEGRLYSINGAIRWDKAELTFGEATTVLQNGGAGEDVAVLIEHVTEYAQTSPWSDLGIAHDCPLTGLMAIPGVNLAGFDHSKHEWIASAYRKIIDEYGIDIWVGLDDTLHSRVKRGSRRDELAVSIDYDDPDSLAVLAAHKVTGDPTQGCNVAVIVGESTLFAADEAGALNLAAFGGMTIGKWDSAPAGTTPLGLAERAQRIVDTEAVAPAFPDLLIPLSEGVVEIGDVIPVTLSAGWVQASADYRATQITVDPRALNGVGVQRVQVDVDDGVPLDSEGS